MLFAAIAMRLVLTVVNYCMDNYNVDGWALYYLWVLEQMHFMIIVMLFFTIIGSWRLSTQLRQQCRRFDQSQMDRRKQKSQMD